MPAVFIAFTIALVLSMAITPVARVLGHRIGAMDTPNSRKHHAHPTPRSGGVAIVVSFLIAIALGITVEGSTQTRTLLMTPATLFLGAGALLCFTIGLIDDIRRLSAPVKLAGQILTASIAFYGGVRINLLPFVGTEISPWLSYGLTVFWFVLFINAINLIDGLDGLAAGICLFTCLMLVILSVLRGSPLLALMFAALSGTLLGFLRYNYVPSTIFMGDSGSYFLGYIISGLSIYGSAKGQLGATFLIPFICMGVPIFDTLLTPLRRFIRGRGIFSPDHKHIHHKLLAIGLTTKRAVHIIYLLTILLCLLSIVTLHTKNEMAAGIVIIMALSMFVCYRTVTRGGPSFRNFLVWLHELADALGLSKDRRVFLDIQLRMDSCATNEDVWDLTCEMLSKYCIDFAELRLAQNNGSNPRQSPCPRPPAITMEWAGPNFDHAKGFCGTHLLKIELPLITSRGTNLGELWIVKDIRNSPLNGQLFVRLEQLRRTLVETLPAIPSRDNALN